MPRPSKPIKRSILESSNAKITNNERDLNTTFKVSTSSKNEKINDDEPVFNLVLTPDILKDLQNSSEKIYLERKPILSTKFNSGKSSPAIEISSSSGEEEFFYHLSSSREVGRSFPTKALSSSEDNKKSLLGENSSLANSNELSQGQNSSTPKRHKNKIFLIKRKPKKEVEMSEDSDSDPFGFRKAEKRNMIKKGRNKFDKISDGSEKSEVTTINTYSQYNDNVQCEMISQNISLNKENDVGSSGDLCEIDREHWAQRSQESKKYNTSIESRKDDNQVDTDNNQPLHDEDHLLTEIDKESLEVSPRDNNKKEEKKMPNATTSKVKKTSTITKTTDLVSLLPPRRRRLERASKNKIDDYNDTQSDNEGEVVSPGEEESSNYEKKTQKRKLRGLGKMQNEKSEKRKTRKIKKELFTCESQELDEKLKQERAKRVRHSEEIDNFVLAEEVVC